MCLLLWSPWEVHVLVTSSPLCRTWVPLTSCRMLLVRRSVMWLILDGLVTAVLLTGVMLLRLPVALVIARACAMSRGSLLCRTRFCSGILVVLCRLLWVNRLLLVRLESRICALMRCRDRWCILWCLSRIPLCRLVCPMVSLRR